MIFGFNTTVTYGESVYHVQSEPRERERVLETQVFVGGRCLGKRATPYDKIFFRPGSIEEQLHELLRSQHRLVVEAARKGCLQDALDVPRAQAELSLQFLNADSVFADEALVMRFQVTQEGTRDPGRQPDLASARARGRTNLFSGGHGCRGNGRDAGRLAGSRARGRRHSGGGHPRRKVDVAQVPPAEIRLGLIPAPSVWTKLVCAESGNAHHDPPIGAFISSSLLACALFHLQQGLLPLAAPAIAAQFTRAAHHAMARNGHSYRIAGARLGYGTHASGLADGAGDLTVGFCRAIRDGLEVLPDTTLKRRCLHIEWQLRQRTLAVKLLEQGAHPAPQHHVAAAKGCVRKLALATPPPGCRRNRRMRSCTPRDRWPRAASAQRENPAWCSE